MGSETFTVTQSLWLFKVCIKLVTCGFCIFENIMFPFLPLFPLHIP